MMDRINRLMKDDEFLQRIGYINEKEINREFCRHGLSHLLDTARIAYILNLEENMGLDKEMIYAMALLHDIGRSEDKSDEHHSKAGLPVANALLERNGFDSKEIEVICHAIEKHSSGNDGDAYAELLYRADKLSRDCYECGAIDKCYWNEDIKNRKLKY